jgi:hypothetical protein
MVIGWWGFLAPTITTERHPPRTTPNAHRTTLLNKYVYNSNIYKYLRVFTDLEERVCVFKIFLILSISRAAQVGAMIGALKQTFHSA